MVWTLVVAPVTTALITPFNWIHTSPLASRRTLPKRPLKVSLSPQMTVSPYPENTLPKQALRICEWSISYRFGRQIPHLTLQKRKVGQLLKWATAGVGSFCLEVLTSYFSNINVTGACWLNKQLIQERVWSDPKKSTYTASNSNTVRGWSTSLCSQKFPYSTHLVYVVLWFSKWIW